MKKFNSEILAMAVDYGRLESTLAAVEWWYEDAMERNKAYVSFSRDLKPLGVILGIEEEEPEEKTVEDEE